MIAMMPDTRKVIYCCLLAACLYVPVNAHAIVVGTQCTVGTTSTNFGAYWGDLLTSTGSVSISCTGTATTQVSLDKGQNSTTYTTRKLASGANTINYNLYTSATRRFVWGDGTAGNYTRTGTNLTVFGSIPAGQNVTPGSYSDTVVVTVTW